MAQNSYTLSQTDQPLYLTRGNHVAVSLFIMTVSLMLAAYSVWLHMSTKGGKDGIAVDLFFFGSIAVYCYKRVACPSRALYKCTLNPLRFPDHSQATTTITLEWEYYPLNFRTSKTNQALESAANSLLSHWASSRRTGPQTYAEAIESTHAMSLYLLSQFDRDNQNRLFDKRLDHLGCTVTNVFVEEIKATPASPKILADVRENMHVAKLMREESDPHTLVGFIEELAEAERDKKSARRLCTSQVQLEELEGAFKDRIAGIRNKYKGTL